jgi:hypothetical protein
MLRAEGRGGQGPGDTAPVELNSVTPVVVARAKFSLRGHQLARSSRTSSSPSQRSYLFGDQLRSRTSVR